MRIAMVSEHASPLAVLGGVDAGGQNVHVAALSLALAARGHEVTVYTRRDDPDAPLQVPLGPGVEVVNVPAGPAEQLPKDELLPFMPEFGRWLASTLESRRAAGCRARPFLDVRARSIACDAGNKGSGGADLPCARHCQAPLSG